MLAMRATVDQNSSSVQIASAYHVGAAVLVHVARSGQLDSALDERSLGDVSAEFKWSLVIATYIRWRHIESSKVVNISLWRHLVMFLKSIISKALMHVSISRIFMDKLMEEPKPNIFEGCQHCQHPLSLFI